MPLESSAVESGQAAGAAIVGTWVGVHECEGIVETLTSAGFDEGVVIENLVGNGLLESAVDTDDLATLCDRAATLEHSHEFTADGRFLSFDDAGQQVDSGTWDEVDGDTITIGDDEIPFDYSVDGDRLTLRPVIEEGCLDFGCQWAIMVAMPWTELERQSE